jgi:tape measure domain-containing protein
MAEITAELDLEISRFRAALGRANSRLDGFSKRGEKSGRDLGNNLASGLKSALLPAIAALGIGSLIGAGISKSIQAAASDEQLKVSMDVLVGDSSEATSLINQLRKDAASTPLEFGDLGDAAKKLLAFGSAASEVPEQLRRIGDISSGVGAGLGEIAEIYGKARVQGTLFAEDINQLTGRGIPVIQEFAKQLGVAESQVKKMGSEGKITFTNLDQAFKELTSQGGLFAGMMARQAETILGKWSTLKDGINQLYLQFGKPIGESLKPILDDLSERVDGLQDEAGQIGEAVARGLEFAQAAIDSLTLTELMEMAGLALKIGFQEAANVLARGVKATIESAKDGDVVGEIEVRMEMAALRFKEILLEAAAETADALAAGAGGKLKVALENSAYNARASAGLADAQREAIEEERKQKPGIDLTDRFSKYFKEAAGIFDTEGDRYDLERYADKIRVKADELTTARRGKAGSGAAPTPAVPGAGSIVPSLTQSAGGLGGVSLESATSYFGGGNLQAEGNRLLAEIARNTKPRSQEPARSAPPMGAAVFG